MMRALKCWLGFHLEPSGWNPAFSWGYRCHGCRRDVKGELR